MEAKFAKKLNDRRVLILGGTSGIGFAVAEGSVEFGGSVIVASSKQENVNRAVERLKGAYPSHESKIHGLQCDISDENSMETNIEMLLKSATECGGGLLDHICFTAGDRIKFGALKDVTVAVFHDIARVRVLGATMLAKHAPAYMENNASSSITFTGGSVGAKPAAYGASVVSGFSSFMEGLARGLAMELRPLRVNVVSPGAVYTEHFDNIEETRKAAIIEGFGKETCVGEIGKPHDVAEGYLYSMRNNFVTGAVLDNNGGRLLM